MRPSSQAVQFLPAFILPQLLLCGLLAPRESMSRPLELISDVAPITYAYGALDRVTRGLSGTTLGGYVFAIAGFMRVALVLGAFTLRPRTAWWWAGDYSDAITRPPG